VSIVDARPTVETPDDDPYLWLEETESALALAWVDAQNAATTGQFSDGRFAADRDRMLGCFFLLYAPLALATKSASSRLNRSGSSRKGACPASAYQDAVLVRHFLRI
jgi:hypothetical protein